MDPIIWAEVPDFFWVGLTVEASWHTMQALFGEVIR